MGRLDELFSLCRTYGTGDRRQFGYWTCFSEGVGHARGGTVLVARRQDELSAAVRALASEGIHAIACPADLSTPAGLDGVADAVKQSGMKVDIVVNSAGVNLRQPFAEVSMDGVRSSHGDSFACAFSPHPALCTGNG